jgi:hypothetical protein
MTELERDIWKFKIRWKSYHNPFNNETNSYEYVNIGNNIEFDYFSFNLYEEGGISVMIHLRNQKQITQSVLADTLSYIRNYIISETDQIQLSSGTMEFFKIICGQYQDFRFKVSNVLFDPGFQAHESVEKDMGLTLSTMEIWFDQVFNENERIFDFMREEITMKDFIFNPQPIFDRVMFTKPQVDIFNEKLFNLSNRLNQHKKFDIMLKQFLKGGKTRLAVEISMSDTAVEGKSIEVSWHYEIDENDPPYIKMRVEHSKLYKNDKGSLWGYIHEDGKGGSYVIRLTEESYQKLSEVNEPWPEIENYIISSFKYYINRLLEKNHMSFSVNEDQFVVVDH